MGNNINRRTRRYQRERARARRRTRFVSVLGLVVLLATAYMLILPALTVSYDCGLKEHAHTEACYEGGKHYTLDNCDVLAHLGNGSDPSQIGTVIHTHNALCFDENGKQICPLKTGITAHEHDDACYETEQLLICPQAESAHTHDDSCYEMVAQLDCDETEHTHGAECYTAKTVWDCTKGEHVHTEDCYTTRETKSMTCTAGEHSHSGDCYRDELTCTDESEEHTHGGDCYASKLVCGQNEHSHGDGCYTTETVRELTCSLAEHTHDDACSHTESELTCTQKEHTHSEACETLVRGELTCTQTGHTHDASCYETHRTLVCDRREIIIHDHDEDCYDRTTGHLICTKPWVPRHEHTADCIREHALICGEAEHTHTDQCQKSEADFILGDLPEEDAPSIDEPETDEPTIDEPIVDGPNIDEPAIDEPIVDGPSIDEPAIDEPIVDGPSIDEPAIDEPIVDGPSIDEPTIDEPVIDEPSMDEVLPEGEGDDLFPEGSEDAETPEEEGDDLFPEDAETPEEEAPDTATPDEATPDETDELPTDTATPDEAEIEDILDMLEGDLMFGTLGLGNANGVLPNPTDSTEPMSGHIRGATLQRYNYTSNQWEDVPKNGSGEYIIHSGDKLQFRLDYNLPAHTLDENKNTLTYQIPFQNNTWFDPKEFTNGADNSPAGSYSIKNSLITITFNESFVNKNSGSDGMGGSEIEGFVTFEAQASEIKTGDDGKKEITFSSGTSIKVFEEDKVVTNDDLKVKKEAISIDKGTDTITYRVLVSSKNGTHSVVNMTDKLDDRMALVEGSIKYATGVRDPQSNPLPTPSTSVESTGTGNDFAFQLPQMNANDLYVVEYQAKWNGEPLNGHASDVKNTVTAESTNQYDLTLKDSSEVKTYLDSQKLNKQGTVVTGDDSQKYVDWTITVNDAHADLTGWTLSDTFNGASLTSQVVGNITLTEKGEGGKVTTITLPHTFSASDGGMHSTYTITYRTAKTNASGENTPVNTATLEIPNRDPITSTDRPEEKVDPGDMPDGWMEKTSGGYVKNDDGQTVTFNWHLKIDASGGAISDIKIKDRANSDINNHWFTGDQLRDVKTKLEAAVQGISPAVTVTLTPQTTSKEETSIGDSTKYVGFNVTFSPGLPKGTVINLAYQSTGKLADYDYNVKNDIRVGSDTITGAETPYKPDTLKITKKDQNGGDKAETEHKYGDVKDGLVWKLELQVPSGYREKFTVIENLPDGLELTKIKFEASSFNKEITNVGASGSQKGDNPSDGKVVDYTLVGNTLTMDFSKQFTNPNGTEWVKIYLTCKVKEDFAWPSDKIATFNNTVTVKDNEDKVHGTASQTQKIDGHTEHIKKSIGGPGWAENNILPYVLDINPSKADLKHDSATVKLNDVIMGTGLTKPYTLSLIPSSVVVTDVETGQELNPHEYKYTFQKSIVEVPPQWTGDVVHYRPKGEIEFELPDERHLKLEYKYSVQGLVVGDQFSADNTAELITDVGGLGDATEGSKKLDVQVKQSTAGATTSAVLIRKVDRDNYALRLSGVEFKLEKQIAGGGYQTVIETLTTGNKGDITLNQLENDVLYRLVETKPINGYKPRDPWYFMIRDSASKPAVTADEGGGSTDGGGSGSGSGGGSPEVTDYHEIYHGSTNYIENEAKKFSIAVTKVWRDENGEKIPFPDGMKATFVLSRSSDEWETSTVVLDSQKTADVNNQTLTWENLPMVDGQGVPYQYRATEIKITSGSDEKDIKHEYIIYWSQTVEGEPPSEEAFGNGNMSLPIVVDPDDHEDTTYPINCNNAKISKTTSLTLPETGGSGTFPIQAAGAALILCAAVGIAIRSKSRREGTRG